MNTNTTNTIVGYFATHAQAESAVDALKAAGFEAREVGMAARGGYFGNQSSLAGTDRPLSGTDDSVTGGRAYAGSETTTGTATGHTTGEHGTGFWAKVKDFFEGGSEGGQQAEPYAGESTGDPLASREITYDEYGPDDVRHSLSGLSVPEEHSNYFGQKFRSGSEGAVVTVTTNDRQDQAREILQRCGADLGENAANYKEDTADYNDTRSGNTGSEYQGRSADFGGTEIRSDMSGTEGRRANLGETRDEGRANDRITADQNIRLYGEVLRVHKERINRGEVRVRKEVHTDTQTVEVPVTREELVIERRPASGQQAAGDAKFGEQEVRIPLTEERASIDKQAVVTEEVRVGKREVTNVQSMDEQVRHEELKVDDSTKTA